jgi:hypothetical protein
MVGKAKASNLKVNSLCDMDRSGSYGGMLPKGGENTGDHEGKVVCGDHDYDGQSTGQPSSIPKEYDTGV